MTHTTSNDTKSILSERVNTLSSGPGVYLMKNGSGDVIYVGKAKNLKKRVGSYFKRENYSDMKTGVLVGKIQQFDTILTATEQEALILEANLIRKHKPRYNVILKDDKRYPLLRIDVTTEYPNLTIARKMKKDGALYFGPYASAGAVHQTVKFINKTFKLRKCHSRMFKNRTRPCLNHQIGACLAPCCLDVDNEEYKRIIDEVALFLKGKTPDLIRRIKNDMAAAAMDERYEEAAQLRDRLFAIEKTLEKQHVVSTDMVDRDVIAVSKGTSLSLITVLSIRGGGLSGSRHFTFHETLADDEALIGTFICQYYETAPFIPPEIVVPVLPDDHQAVSEFLKNLRKSQVVLVEPRRGDKLRYIEMAKQNGAKELEDRENASRSSTNLLLRLKKKLGMEKIPARIECFDNSNISGKEPVSAMVVFKDGKPFKSGYRKYTLKTVDIQDDYSYMNEVLRRRYAKDDPDTPLPDLLMVDGGKGQLNVAVSVLKEVAVDNAFHVVGIAKKDERKGETMDKIFVPGRSNPLNFSRDEDLLFFLQSIRDEAHRFVIQFHRKRRNTESLASIFDTIPGIGPKRKKNLLIRFGGMENLRSATLEDLMAVDGISEQTARKLYEVIHK